MARILVVDDAKVVREKLKLIFKKGQHEVVGESSNGLQAFLLYEQLMPDVVTMDITMPGVDGIEGIKKIKSKYPKACIVVVSAMSQKSVILEALDCGAESFILKPFESDKVLGVIGELLQGNKISKEEKEPKTLSSLNEDVLVPAQKAEVDANLFKEMMALKKKNSDKEALLRAIPGKRG